MKKICILLMLTGIAFMSSAQEVRFSFMASPQLSWLSPDISQVEGAGAHLGLNTGIEMDVFFAERYAFSTGISLNNKGGRLTYNDTIRLDIENQTETFPPNNELIYRIQYLSIPLGLKFKTIEIGYTTFWVNAGITPMAAIRSRLKDENNVVEKVNIENEIGLFNLNYFVEGGVEYSLGGTTAIIGGLGYYSGFMDVTNRSQDKISTRSIALVFGILF